MNRINRLAPLALAFIAGCSARGAGPRNADGSRMTRDEMLVRGDNLMIAGRRLKEQGAAEGSEEEVSRGESLLDLGRRMKADAAKGKE